MRLRDLPSVRDLPMSVRYGSAAALLILSAGATTFGLTRLGFTWVAVVGVGTGLLGLWLIYDTLFNRLDSSDGVSGRWLFTLVGLASFLLPIVMLNWYESMPPLLIVGLALVSAGGLACFGAAVRSVYASPGGRRWRHVIGWPGFALSLVGLAGLWLAGAWDALFLASLAATFLGITAAGFALVVSCQETENAELWAAIGAATMVTAAVVVALLAALEVGPLWLAVPVFVGAVGLIPLSQATPRLLQDSANRVRFRFVAIAVIGSAVGATLMLLFSGADWSLGFTLVVVTGLALVALAYVADVSALVLYFLVVVVVAGVMIDRSEGDLASGGSQRLVVFGDSYISGEGAYAFVEGTNVATTNAASLPTSNECRRSVGAYPNRLAVAKGWTLETYACSGARSYDVAAINRAPLTRKPSTQIEEFLGKGGTQGDDIAAVLVSIGGNDAWFGAIGQACLGPGSCEVHRESVVRNLAVVGSRVRQVYAEIKEAVGYPAVAVYAIPYPLVMTYRGCEDSPLTNAEQEFLFEFSEVLNDTLRVEAERAGVNWVDAAASAHVGHRMCEDGALSINEVNVLPKEGPLSARINPTNWVKGSAHPHDDGHEFTYEAISSVFDGELGNPEANDSATLEIVAQERTVSRGALGIPAGAGCGEQEIPVSLRIHIRNSNADPELLLIGESSRLCTNLPDGGLSVFDPYDRAADDLRWSSAGVRAVPEDVRPEFHWITYQDASGQWRAVVNRYCDLRSDCAATETELLAWMQGEIEATVRSAVVPVVLVFAAFWFLFVAVKDGLSETRAGSEPE